MLEILDLIRVKQGRPILYHYGFSDSVWERMAGRVAPQDSGCWLWTGVVGKASRGSHGYGYLWVDKGNVLIHRLVWQMCKGEPAPSDPYCLSNTCGNSLCCNPDHWTQKLLIQPTIEPGKKRAERRRKAAFCIHGHRYTRGNTAYDSRTGARYCKACNRERQQRFQERRR